MGHGDILQKLLEYKKMDVATLGRIANIPKTTLYSIIKRNNTQTRKDVLAKISNALNIPITIWDQSSIEELMLITAFDIDISSEYKAISKEVVDACLEQKGQPFEYIKYALDCMGYDNKYSVEELKNMIETEVPVSPNLVSDIYHILTSDALITREELALLEKYHHLTKDSKQLINSLINKLGQSDMFEREKDEKLVKTMFSDQ